MRGEANDRKIRGVSVREDGKRILRRKTGDESGAGEGKQEGRVSPLIRQSSSSALTKYMLHPSFRQV